MPSPSSLPGRALGAILAGLLRLLHFPSARESLHGTARWMGWWERRRFLSPRHTGLLLGPRHRLSQEDSFKNLVLVASTGSGKTSRFVVPNLLRLHGSVVVTDPSGELFRLTSGHLAARGYHIQVLAPADPGHSLRFNPLLRFRSQQELRRLATILGQNVGSAHADPFWQTSAVNLLYLGLSALSRVEDPRVRHLGSLRSLLNQLSGSSSLDPHGVHGFFCRYLEERAFSEYLAFLAGDSKVIASVLSTARACLDLWADPDVVRLSAADSVDLPSLRTRPTAIYLVIPEHQVAYFAPLLNLFYSTTFEFCLTHSEGLPVSFLLDEFGNLHIPHFGAIATTLRKRHCSLAMVCQSSSQLAAVYGPHEAKTILFGGAASHLYFGGLDHETCRTLEQVLGQHTAFDTPFGEEQEHARSIGKPLLSADQIRLLGQETAILISGRERPARLHMPPYFAFRSLRALTSKPPAELRFDYSREEVRFVPPAAEGRVRSEGSSGLPPASKPAETESTRFS